MNYYLNFDSVYQKSYHLVNVFAILMSVLVVFWGITNLDFQMQWDDYWVVMNSYTDKGFTPSNAWSVITDFYHSQYAPVNEFYYIFINALFGYDPLFFHLGGLVLHIANALFVYFLVFNISTKAFNQRDHKASRIALIATLIFALHPFNLEAVAWIAASKILLYTLFYLIALSFYIKYVTDKKVAYLILSTVFFVISFGAKEQAITFPFCTLLIDYVFKVPLHSLRFWIEKAFLFALSLYFGLVTIRSQGDINLEIFDFYSLPERLVLAFYTLSEYLTKCILPLKLSYVYPFPFAPGGQIPWWLFIYPITLLIALILSFKKIITTNWLLFGLSMFLIHIGIGLHLISLARHSVVADRYGYISTIGIAFLIAYFLLNDKFGIRRQKAAKLITVFYLLFLSVSTWQHLPIWKNSQSLKKSLADQINKRDDYKQLQEQYRKEVE